MSNAALIAPLPSLHHYPQSWMNNSGSTPPATALASSWIQGDNTPHRDFIQRTEDTYIDYNYDNVTSPMWARPSACVGHPAITTRTTAPDNVMCFTE
ncbi:hypothetical protein K439DRAFT_869996 [Ramaria rubella]|nr:hypothetical protein K439DRAFT_869996 [Ramaria rubella]